MNDFTLRCLCVPAEFERPIKRQKIITFAEDGAVVKRTAKGVIEEIKMERDLMGKLLMISLKGKLDIGIVLTYPLTPVPLVFCHLDVTINRTNKAVLFKNLEKRIISDTPQEIDAYIIDGFFFLHLMINNLPSTFEAIARVLFIKLCSYKGKQIHLIFDHIVYPSIKDCERDRRSDGDHVEYGTIGNKQRRPGNFLKTLRNDNFKSEFVKFLTTAFEEESLSETCYCYKVVDGKIWKSTEGSMSSSHEEADTKIIAHLATIPPPANVVIRTSDTDVLVIALANNENIRRGVQTYLEVGLSSNNSLRFINVTKLAVKLGPLLCKALTGLHCFTGCDHAPEFSRKGKIGPLAIKKKTSLPRSSRFSWVYQSTTKRPMSTVKGIDGSSLPPCKLVLQQQINRANCICSAWNFAFTLSPNVFFPQTSGWNIEKDDYGNERFSVNWFEGDLAPQTLEEVLQKEKTTESEIREEENDDEEGDVEDES
ncbi:Uncharacterized protein APZ42_012648 [Daphnia magna]|uniref:Uncharacterized protein n=1 Tax=Daphnia magna TaxID=35525 RepID=A0A162RLM9_9CRUS|nr:Uncharacterized protein APZ42_012648 [Daphnia magna]